MSLLEHFSHVDDFCQAFVPLWQQHHLSSRTRHHRRGRLVRSQRFVELMPTTLVPLCAYFQSWFGTCTGISFIDSTALAVCHNRRIQQHKVFANLAKRGKTSFGWFYGFKVDIV